MKSTRRTVALVVIFVGLAARQLVAAPQTNAPAGPAVGSPQAGAQATGTEPGAGSTRVPITVFADPDGLTSKEALDA
jgi:hypothetical protein